MKPGAFDYYRPINIEQTLELLAEYGDDAKVLAGGQSLIPMMNFRIVQPTVLVDINRVANMSGIRETDSGSVMIDALTREKDLEESRLLSLQYPLLAQALPFIGHLAIRSRGTIGGSIVQADPTGELPLTTLLLESVFHVRGKDGIRQVPADEFFITYLTVDVQPEELLVGIELPVANQATWAFEEFAQRRGDFALVSAAAGLRMNDAGIIEFARFGAGGVDATPLRLTNVEDMLVGERPTKALFDEALETAMNEIDPEADVHASADYRRQLMKVLGRRALERCVPNKTEVTAK